MITDLRPRAEAEMASWAFDPSCKLFLPLKDLDGDSFMSKDVYGHVCTRYGDAHWTPQGWLFDGDGDNINCGTASALNPITEHTLEAWINPNDASGLAAILGKLKFAIHSWGLYQDSGKFLFQFRGDGTGVDVHADSTYTVGNWYHVVATRRNNLTNNLYIDGIVQVNEKNSSESPLTATNAFKIGTLTSDLAFFFTGLIGAVLIHSRALTPHEIQRHHIVGKELFA